MKNFLAKIQKSEENIKKRYLIIFSIIAMIIIIWLWVLYLKTMANPTITQEFFKKISINLNQWLKFIFLKIKEGRVIFIER